MKTLKQILALCALALWCGCAALNPGTDPVAVRAEQTVAIAKTTLDTFNKLERANVVLVKEKAPQVHEFAEWLRRPVEYQGELVPNAYAIQQSANLTRLAYKKNRSPENKAQLEAALAALSQAVAEATKHLNSIPR